MNNSHNHNHNANHTNNTNTVRVPSGLPPGVSFGISTGAPDLPTKIILLRLLDSNFPGDSLWASELKPFKLRLCLTLLQSNPLTFRILVRPYSILEINVINRTHDVV